MTCVSWVETMIVFNTFVRLTGVDSIDDRSEQMPAVYNMIVRQGYFRSDNRLAEKSKLFLL